MARRNSRGCGCLVAGSTIGLPIVGTIVAAALLALVAPALLPFLLLNYRPQFERYAMEWWAFLAAAPIVAFALVVLVGRVGKRGNRQTGRRPTAPKPPRQWPLFRGRMARAGILLLVTNVTALILLLLGYVPFGANAALPTAVLFGGSGVAGAVALFAIRLWDRTFPPGQRFEPVTIKAVRDATAEAERTLRRVRANNLRISKQASAVEAQLRSSGGTAHFVGMCELHYESRGCADSMYQHYDMTRDLVYGLSGIVLRARTTATMRLRSEVDPKTGRRCRPNRAALTAATADLARTRALLRDEVDKGLAQVNTLNMRTADLKYSIRDSCGGQGQRWFDDLEARTQARREANRQAPV